MSGKQDNPWKKADMALLLALACGATAEQAASKAGLSARTVRRRLADPEFRRQVQAQRADMLQRSAATLTAAAGESIKTLLALQQPSEPGTVRLGAAKAILEIGMKLRELVDVEQRLADLEQRLEAKDAMSA